MSYLRIKNRQAEVLLEYQAFISDKRHRHHTYWFEWEEDETLYNIDQAVQLTGWGRERVEQMARLGYVPSVKRSGRWFIPLRFLQTLDYSMKRLGHPQAYWDRLTEFVIAVRELNGPTRGVDTQSRIDGRWCEKYRNSHKAPN